MSLYASGYNSYKVQNSSWERTLNALWTSWRRRQSELYQPLRRGTRGGKGASSRAIAKRFGTFWCVWGGKQNVVPRTGKIRKVRQRWVGAGKVCRDWVREDQWL